MFKLRQMANAVGVISDPLLPYKLLDPAPTPDPANGAAPKASGSGFWLGHGALWYARRAVVRNTGEAVTVVSCSVACVRAAVAAAVSAGVAEQRAAELLERLRHSVATLAKLRHPNIVRVVAPLAEDSGRGLLFFVTERLLCPLAALCDAVWERETNRPLVAPPADTDAVFGFDDAGAPGHVGTADDAPPAQEAHDVAGPAAAAQLSAAGFDELDTDVGLTGLSSALAFLHDAAGLALLGLSPTSAVVTTEGPWKLVDFTFACGIQDLAALPPVHCDHFAVVRAGGHPEVAPLLSPDLAFAGPDFAQRNAPSVASDQWALAALIFYCRHSVAGRLPRLRVDCGTSVAAYDAAVAALSDGSGFVCHPPGPSAGPHVQSAGLDLFGAPAGSAEGGAPAQGWVQDVVTLSQGQAAPLSTATFVAGANINGPAARTVREAATVASMGAEDQAACLAALYRIAPDLAASTAARRVLPPLTALLAIDDRFHRYVAPIVARTMPALARPPGLMAAAAPPALLPLLRSPVAQVHEILLDEAALLHPVLGLAARAHRDHTQASQRDAQAGAGPSQDALHRFFAKAAATAASAAAKVGAGPPAELPTLRQLWGEWCTFVGRCVAGRSSPAVLVRALPAACAVVDNASVPMRMEHRLHFLRSLTDAATGATASRLAGQGSAAAAFFAPSAQQQALQVVAAHAAQLSQADVEPHIFTPLLTGTRLMLSALPGAPAAQLDVAAVTDVVAAALKAVAATARYAGPSHAVRAVTLLAEVVAAPPHASGVTDTLVTIAAGQGAELLRATAAARVAATVAPSDHAAAGAPAA